MVDDEGNTSVCNAKIHSAGGHPALLFSSNSSIPTNGESRKAEANSDYDSDYFTLSNGEQYRSGDNVWVEVQPVKWLVDEKSRMMITEKWIFAGVQFNKENHTRDFDRTDIKTFMDTYWSRDWVQERGITEQTRTSSKTTKRNENPYNLDFSEASETDIIRGAIQSNVSIFLHGKPGCGKSDRVKQLLFLEELTNALQMMQSKAYGIALDKKVAGRWKLPENARMRNGYFRHRLEQLPMPEAVISLIYSR